MKNLRQSSAISNSLFGSTVYLRIFFETQYTFMPPNLAIDKSYTRLRFSTTTGTDAMLEVYNFATV